MVKTAGFKLTSMFTTVQAKLVAAAAEKSDRFDKPDAQPFTALPASDNAANCGL
jgi:hypothetical protein